METLNNIKSSLIDRIMVSRDEKLLRAIRDILNSQKGDRFPLDPAQVEMLLMSEKDIEEGRLVSESELEKRDKKWLG